MHEKYDSLKNFVEDMNFWYELKYGGDDKSDHFEYPVIIQTTATAIFHELDSAISPEQLHEDGEIPAEEADLKFKRILAIAIQLQRKGFTYDKKTELGYYLS